MNTSHKTTTREKINRILNERMPGFATSFFRARNNSMTELSLYAYALDISLFFDYLEDIKSIPVREITIRDFENITKEEKYPRYN